jgi:hypothetical protein
MFLRRYLSVCFLSLMILPGALSAAEDDATLTYDTGHDIMVPIKPSLERENHWRRALVFQGCKKISAQTDADPADLYTEIKGNVLYVMLLKPQFTTSLFVTGDNGIQYPLFIYGADRNEDLPGQVTVTLGNDAAKAKKSLLDQVPESLDSQVIRLSKHVYGHKLQDGVQESPEFDREQLDKGVRQIGRRFYESDSFSMLSVRIYRMKDIECHMCVVTTKGDHDSVSFPFQDLVVPNQLFFLPRHIDVVDAQYPGMILRKGEPRVLYLFCRASEGK